MEAYVIRRKRDGYLFCTRKSGYGGISARYTKNPRIYSSLRNARSAMGQLKGWMAWGFDEDEWEEQTRDFGIEPGFDDREKRWHLMALLDDDAKENSHWEVVPFSEI